MSNDQTQTSGLREKVSQLAPEDRKIFFDHIRTGVFHMASCWDELGAAEALVAEEIETDELSTLAGDVNMAGEAFELSEEEILDALEEAE